MHGPLPARCFVENVEIVENVKDVVDCEDFVDVVGFEDFVDVVDFEDFVDQAGAGNWGIPAASPQLDFIVCGFRRCNGRLIGKDLQPNFFQASDLV